MAEAVSRNPLEAAEVDARRCGTAAEAAAYERARPMNRPDGNVLRLVLCSVGADSATDERSNTRKTRQV